MDNVFPVAIFKKNLPEKCTPIDIVMATKAQFGEDKVDMIQSINGLYKIDFKRSEEQIQILGRGLSLKKLTIQASVWREGMDCPQVRLVVGPIPRDISDLDLIDALEKSDMWPVSSIGHDYWRNSETGLLTKIKTGKKIVFIKKDSTPIPDKIFINDKELPIWYWGKKNINAGRPSKETMRDPQPAQTKPVKIDVGTGTNCSPSSSLQADEADDIISPTPPVADVFKKPQQNINDSTGRVGRPPRRGSVPRKGSSSRDQSHPSERKRSASREPVHPSPSKVKKPENITAFLSPSTNRTTTSPFPGEAAGEESGA